MMNDNIEDDIRAAMGDEQQDTPEDDLIEVTPQETTPEEVTPPTETVPTPEPTVQTPQEPVVEPPVSLSGAIKAKWKDLPSDVQQEWRKREDDMHRMMTAHDGELRIGRSIKEIATPYEALIRSEGGTIEGAFKDLLNTSYILRTGSPHQKAAVLMQAAQQFGVDLSLHQQQQQNPQLAQLQNEIHQLRQASSPDVIEKQLQERLESVRIADEIKGFAANPKNVHFDAVREAMGALMTTGRAKDLQEAYEMACWADPSIRATNLAAQAEQDKAKRKAEMDAKRKASASVVGSPNGASPSANAPNHMSIEDEVRNAFREASGGSI